MPIRPQFRYLYPNDWPQLSATIRFKRAGGQCEHCGRPHGQTVKHLGNDIWWDEQRQVWRNGQGRALPHLIMRDGLSARSTRIVLATAHRDHDPTHNRPKKPRGALPAVPHDSCVNAGLIPGQRGGVNAGQCV